MFFLAIDTNNNYYCVQHLSYNNFTMPELLKNKIKIYQQATNKLIDAINHDDWNDEFIQDSILQRFKFCIELAWKTWKKILEREWYSDLKFPRQVFQTMAETNIINNLEIWIDFLEYRNTLSHCYWWAIADEIYHEIKKEYAIFIQLAEYFTKLSQS